MNFLSNCWQRRGLMVAMILGVLPGTLPAEQAAGQASAGWAEVDITPPLGIALGGRAGAGTVADKVLDPLQAQVLILKDARGTNFVLASFDLVGLPHDLSDRIRTRIVQAVGVQWDLVVLNAAHDHSGPYVLRSLMAGVGPSPQNEVDYSKFLEEQIVAATRRAAKQMKPVAVETFNGTSTVGINRRGKNEQGIRMLTPDVHGPFDEKVWVMKITPSDGSAPAVVFSYACHAVIVYGFDLAAISGDFPAATRKALKEALGSGAHVQFVQGFAGDIRPRQLADLDHNRFRAARADDAQIVGKELAASVLAALKTPGQRLALNIAGAADRPFLPRDKPPARAVFERMRDTRGNTNDYYLALSEYWLNHYDSGEGFARGDAWPFGLIRLADNQWVVYSAGEPCIEWRTKIVQWLAPLNIVPWGYCQEANAYLPTDAMLPEGGYEVLQSNEGRESTPAPFAPGIDRIVRESLLRQLAFIKARTE